MLLAGCGGAALRGKGVQIEGAQLSVHTGQPLRLPAINQGTGDPLPVRWRITGTDNALALGAGSVSAEGVYQPPGIVSQDTVTVTLAATPESGGAAVASTTLTVLPGFAQPLQPENASLSPGGTLLLRAQLSEVGSGSVIWELAGAGSEGRVGDEHALGTLRPQGCERGPRQFTTCTVTYTAPASIVPGASVLVVAHAPGEANAPPNSLMIPDASVRAHILLGAVASNAAVHQQQQPGAMALGVSGSNDNDFDTYADSAGAHFVADCCGGTLGALVEDSTGQPYLLSNNHVLATSDQARTGDPIEQPGLIDNGCIPSREPGSQLREVGSLRYKVPLASGGGSTWNVDAALASVRPGTVDASGAILELGEPAPGRGGELQSAPPMRGTGEVLDAERLAGLSVVKSGRTTGLTCSAVEAVDLRVAVEYYEDCAETRPYTRKVFTGQIAVGGDGFADSGDSGALVLDAGNAEAVGLLYATATGGQGNTGGQTGGTDGLTLLHPIGEVLRELGREAGTSFSLRGTSTPHRITCLDYRRSAGGSVPDGSPAAALARLAPDERARTGAAAADAASLREAHPRGVLAVAAGVSADDPGHGAVIVYVDRAQPPTALPVTMSGVRTVTVVTDLATIARGPSAWPSPVAGVGMHLTATALARATVAADSLSPKLMEVPGVLGAGVAESLDSPGEPALLVLLDTDAPPVETARRMEALADPLKGQDGGAALPGVLGGLRVRYVRMHRFHVSRSKYLPAATAGVRSCEANGQLLP